MTATASRARGTSPFSGRSPRGDGHLHVALLGGLAMGSETKPIFLEGEVVVQRHGHGLVRRVRVEQAMWSARTLGSTLRLKTASPRTTTMAPPSGAGSRWAVQARGLEGAEGGLPDVLAGGAWAGTEIGARKGQRVGRGLGEAVLGREPQHPGRPPQVHWPRWPVPARPAGPWARSPPPPRHGTVEGRQEVAAALGVHAHADDAHGLGARAGAAAWGVAGVGAGAGRRTSGRIPPGAMHKRTKDQNVFEARARRPGCVLSMRPSHGDSNTPPAFFFNHAPARTHLQTAAV